MSIIYSERQFRLSGSARQLGAIDIKVVLGNLDLLNEPGLTTIRGSCSGRGGVGQNESVSVLLIGLAEVESNVGPAYQR